ncbi:CD320 antigen [Talpa occidentalis]|uniref:CD320 antigen n=1 Tax=Talpa occidentalis TaxID=50954 RepID=UPI00188DEDE2|nr:CD320 antigen [Talpa occidentalis]
MPSDCKYSPFCENLHPLGYFTGHLASGKHLHTCVTAEDSTTSEVLLAARQATAEGSAAEEDNTAGSRGDSAAPPRPGRARARRGGRRDGAWPAPRRAVRRGWMARGGARPTAALGLALRLLLGFGLGLHATPIPVPTRSSARAQDPSTGSCPPNSLQCRTSGFCMPLSWRCDGDRDCLDGSDEEECRIEPCAQNGQCPPPSGSPCSCDGNDCPDGINKNSGNCTQQSCPAGELRCKLGGDCIPHTWLCDGHPDCPDSSDELGCGSEALQEENATSMATPVTLESVTYLRNATTTSTGDSDQSGTRSAYGVIAAVVVLSVGVAATAILALSRLWAPGCLHPLGLLLVVKESLLLPERKTSLL